MNNKSKIYHNIAINLKRSMNKDTKRSSKYDLNDKLNISFLFLFENKL